MCGATIVVDVVFFPRPGQSRNPLCGKRFNGLPSEDSRRQSTESFKFVGLLLRPHDRSIPGRDSILRISRSTGRASGIFRDFPGRPFSAKKKISERFPRRFIRTGRWLLRDFQRFPEISKDFQRLSEIFRDFQRFSKIFRDFPGGCFSRLQKSLADGGGWGQE